MNNIYNNQSTLLYSTAFLGLVKYFFDNVFITLIYISIFSWLIKLVNITSIYRKVNIRYNSVIKLYTGWCLVRLSYPPQLGISPFFIFQWYNFYMNLCGPESFGADPVNVQWQVVRGDTATMRVEFLDDDGETAFDVSNWTFSASSYDPRSDVIDELQVIAGNGYVDITAPTEITSLWGGGYRSVSAELTFDVQAVIDSSTTWTPVIGTIKVLSDVSGSTL